MEQRESLSGVDRLDLGVELSGAALTSARTVPVRPRSWRPRKVVIAGGAGEVQGGRTVLVLHGARVGG